MIIIKKTKQNKTKTKAKNKKQNKKTKAKETKQLKSKIAADSNLRLQVMHDYVKNQKFEIFQSALYMQSGSMPLN